MTTGRWIRLLLLLSTLVGLATMHTLGHGAHAAGGHRADHPAQPARHHLGLPAVLAGPAATAATAMADCPGGGCLAHALPLTGPGGDRSGWSVCVAVLGAFAVALLVAVLLRAGSSAVGRAARGSWRPACGPRDPPPRPWGLRVAAVSVLRR